MDGLGKEWGMEKRWGSGCGSGSESESGLNLTIALTLALALTLDLALLALRDGRGRPRRKGGREGGKTDGMCKETTLLHMLPERLIFTYKLNHDPNDMSHSAHGFWSTEILVSKFLAQREASKAEKLNILIVRIVALLDNRVSHHVTKYISTVKEKKKLEWEGSGMGAVVRKGERKGRVQFR